MKNSSSIPPSSPTPFRTEKTPSDSPTSQPQTQRELIEQAIAATVLEIMQYRRVLWQVLKKTGPTELDETDVNPLWRMQATRTPEGRLRLEATELETPYDHQISELANAIDGTMTPLTDAMDQAGLGNYPPAYIEMMLQSRVVLSPSGYWVDATLAKIAQKPPQDTN